MSVAEGGARDRAPFLLITESFPFGAGEQFLETEVPYLVERFGSFVLAPTRTDGTPRSLPAGVHVDRTLAERWRRPDGHALALLRSEFWRELLSPRAALRPARARRAWLDLARALITRDWLLDVLEPSAGAPTLVYTYWLGPQTLGAVFAKRRRPELRVVSRAHRWDLYEEVNSPPYLPFRGLLPEALDVLHPVSDHGRSYLVDRFGFSPDRCLVARLGVDDPCERARPSDEEAVHILSCSNLVPVKRVPLLARGITAFAARHPDRRVAWTHVGDGPTRSDLEREIENAPENVTSVLRGRLSNREVLALYRRSPVDVFVNVSASEGVPVSIMEAQSFGVPVIATAVGGTPEIVSDVSGRLLPADPAPEAIADALAEVTVAPDAWRTLSDGAYRSWSERYDARRNYTRFAAGLAEAVEVGSG